MIAFLLALLAVHGQSPTVMDDPIAREVRQFKGIIGVSAKNLPCCGRCAVSRIAR